MKATRKEAHGQNFCRFCLREVRFEQHGDKWRCYELDGRRHICPGNRDGEEPKTKESELCGTEMQWPWDSR